jgi:hypothetical protein
VHPPNHLLIRLILCGTGALCSPIVATHAESTSDAPQGNVSQASEERDGQRDFDFHFGTWKTHVRRLLRPLSGSTTWAEYEGTSTVREVWDGRASLFELDVDGPEGRIEGVGLRLYNPQSRQWSLNWANPNDGIIIRSGKPIATSIPLRGSFGPELDSHSGVAAKVTSHPTDSGHSVRP